MAKKIKIEDYEKSKEKIQKQKKSNKQIDKLTMISLIGNGILAIGIAVVVSMYLTLNANSISKKEYDSMLESKNYKISTLEADSRSLKDLLNDKTAYYVKSKLNFMDDNIVFKIKGMGNYYYSYDCMIKKTSGNYEYWAYNKEAAISYGLKAGVC